MRPLLLQSKHENSSPHTTSTSPWYFPCPSQPLLVEIFSTPLTVLKFSTERTVQDNDNGRLHEDNLMLFGVLSVLQWQLPELPHMPINVYVVIPICLGSFRSNVYITQFVNLRAWAKSFLHREMSCSICTVSSSHIRSIGHIQTQNYCVQDLRIHGIQIKSVYVGPKNKYWEYIFIKWVWLANMDTGQNSFPILAIIINLSLQSQHV